MDVKKEIESYYEYLPPLTKRDDFDVFWKDTLEKSGETPLNSELIEIKKDNDNFILFEYYIDSVDGTRINGLFAYPKNISGKIPVLINYHGLYCEPSPIEWFTDYLNMGISVITVNARGQNGKTVDKAVYNEGSDFYGYGILDKNEYYMKNLILDSIRAVDFACSHPFIDQDKIIIEGGSQGGAMAISVCALDSRPWLCLADVPSNSNLEKRVEGRYGGYYAVDDFIKENPEKKEKAYETLSYVDTINMAENIKAKVFSSVGVLDVSCPAKMFFATYNRIKAHKEIIIYENSGHEGGGDLQYKRKLKFVKKELGIK